MRDDRSHFVVQLALRSLCVEHGQGAALGLQPSILRSSTMMQLGYSAILITVLVLVTQCLSYLAFLSDYRQGHTIVNKDGTQIDSNSSISTPSDDADADADANVDTKRSRHDESEEIAAIEVLIEKGMNNITDVMPQYTSKAAEPDSLYEYRKDDPSAQLCKDPNPNMAIVRYAQPLLDFAVIGFGKCGTTTMMKWLNDHPLTQVFQYEVRDLAARKLNLLVQKLYCELKAGRQYKRGYKSPGDINHPQSLGYLRRYFPETKLIVGIRHPVV
jgi:hypothetical protein